MNFHLGFKFNSIRKVTNGNIMPIGKRKKPGFKMKEQFGEIMKQYGISRCTDFFPTENRNIPSQ